MRKPTNVSIHRRYHHFFATKRFVNHRNCKKLPFFTLKIAISCPRGTKDFQNKFKKQVNNISLFILQTCFLLLVTLKRLFIVACGNAVGYKTKRFKPERLGQVLSNPGRVVFFSSLPAALPQATIKLPFRQKLLNVYN